MKCPECEKEMANYKNEMTSSQYYEFCGCESCNIFYKKRLVSANPELCFLKEERGYELA